MFAAWGVLIFAAARSGWGVSGLDNPKTRAAIEQNCPDYYRTKSGDCLRRTFRSYYLVHGIRGGGFGGGK
ncbi:MAG: hypothetical protein D6730_07330 [Bacteroidetes bacterium]|nr:MAG: hypothetical protein D6730_07330 [Bacteroidota bacterium]